MKCVLNEIKFLFFVSDFLKFEQIDLICFKNIVDLFWRIVNFFEFVAIFT